MAMASPAAPIPMTVWRIATGLREQVFPGRRTFQYIAFAADGESLYLGGDHDLSNWRPTRPPNSATFAKHRDEVWDVAFSPDGTDRGLRGERRHPATLGPDHGPRTHTCSGVTRRPSSALDFNLMGPVIALGSLEAQDNVKLWETATGRLIQTLSGHTHRVRSVAFQAGAHSWPRPVPIGRSGSGMATTGAPRAVLNGHDDVVRRAGVFPGGLTLASASNDRTVQLWDVRTGSIPGRLAGPIPGLLGRLLPRTG